MDERKIIENALGGNAVLFLGSGFSVGASNFCEDHKFCIGEGLCEKLIKEGNIDVVGEDKNDLKDLQYISTRYLENNTKRDLIGVLKKNFRCQSVALEHEIVAKIKWKKIYTTNYDDVMEVASRNVSILREAVVATNRLGDIHNIKNAVIHINGFIGNLTEEMLSTTFKLTQESYRSHTISDSDWAISLYSDIKNAKSVIFIGYSLDYDMELQQIFACDERLKEKCLFVVYNPTKRQMTTMKQFGMIYKDGLKEFSKIIEEVEKLYTPIDNKYELKCMKQVKQPDEFAEAVTADDMIRLFVDGIVKAEVVYSIFSNEYLFERDCISEIVDFLSQEGKLTIIHSDLANGKSVALKQLEVKLSQRGNVFYLNEDLNEDLLSDLEYISTQKGNQFLICENYNQLLDGDAWNLLKRFQVSNVK
ncbi:MAG: SIR2 family protein, partial [Lachnospiraceae bacterium]|nr:SIR2 family protein [Lachnospiraceae bacterium]